MLRYDFKKNILSTKFIFYNISICVLVFIFAYISNGLPDITSFNRYISVQWESILAYIFPIICALLITDTVHNEFENGQTKYMLLYIHSKKKLLFHKILMTIIVSAVMLIAMLLFSLIAFALWHSRTIRFTDFFVAAKISIQILFFLIPIELIFIYVAYRGVNVLPIMLAICLICDLMDVLFVSASFTPTSLLNKNYSYKLIVFFAYVLAGLFANVQQALRKDYS